MAEVERPDAPRFGHILVVAFTFKRAKFRAKCGPLEVRRMFDKVKASPLFLLGFLVFGQGANANPAVNVVPKAVSIAQMKQPDEAKCKLPAGWNSVEDLKPEFVIFGELHGTQQSPAFVGDVVCALAASGKRILLGVEFDASLDPQFQTAWKLPHETFAQALSKAGWAGRRDGVASEAMFDLLVRLHALKSRGAAISIVAFNGMKDKEQRGRFAALLGQNSHEAAQAENIQIAARAKTYDLTLVLVGNLHAMKRTVERPGIAFEPMAMRLAASNSVVTLEMKGSGGSAWNCQLKAGFVPQAGQPITDDAITCAIYDTKPDAGLEGTLPTTIRLYSGTQFSNSYDGFFAVGKMTGSRPAVSSP
jgi:hypothetical protein